MMVNPFDTSNAVRYPDETIVPTGVVTLYNQVTSAATYATSNFYSVLTVKPIRIGAAYPSGLASNWDVPYTIIPPQWSVPGGPFNAPSGSTVRSDYGVPQGSWANLSAVDRTLACGMNVKITGLPPNTFLPAGTIYFLQLQEYEFEGLMSGASASESLFINAVAAGKGFSFTLNELQKMDGATLPYLPQGPMSYTFSDLDAYAPWGSGQAFGSYNASGASAGVSSGVMSAQPRLLVAGFGVPSGLEFTVKYVHHLEYVPTVAAAGLIKTEVCPPSTEAREGIARAAQLVQSHLAGRTSAKDVAPIVSPTASGLAGLATSIGKAAVGLIPGASIFVKGAHALSEGLGAPKWLSSVLSSLA